MHFACFVGEVFVRNKTRGTLGFFSYLAVVLKIVSVFGIFFFGSIVLDKLVLYEEGGFLVLFLWG